MTKGRHISIQQAVASGLLSDEEVSAVETGDHPAVSEMEPDSILEQLVERGRLTPFQADRIREGEPGGLIFGEYIVQDKLGQGGMGVVYRAVHRRMDRVVALKQLPSSAMQSPSLVQRFYREVKVAARLTHPNIVTAYDAGEARGTHYLVMEFVDGKDLSATIKQRGTLPVAEAVDYVLQAARGLAYAHENGVIHRDIKPGNMLLASDGTVKILDMGLARFDGEAAADDSEMSVTVAGRFLGTAEYMAPEQAVDAHAADHRADIYSLGCTLYRLIAGRTPYAGKSTIEIVVAQREKPIPSLKAANPEVPPQLESIYLGMIAKRPGDRYQSMSEVVEALEECLRSGVVPVFRSPKSKSKAGSAGGPDAGTSADQRSQPIPVARSKGKAPPPPAPPGAPLAHSSRPQPAPAAMSAKSLPGQSVSALEALANAVGDDQRAANTDADEQASDPSGSDLEQTSDSLKGPPRVPVVNRQPAPRGKREAEGHSTKGGILARLLARRWPLAAAAVLLVGVIILIAVLGGGGGKTPNDSPTKDGIPAVIPAKSNTGSNVDTLPPSPITNTVDMKLVWIKPGSFDMGSPASEVGREPGETQHRVTLTKGFYMATTEVTQAQWKAVMGTNPSARKIDHLPVEEVSWEDAVAFCRKLSDMEGKAYRLPTEAEWEYACRAGTTTAYHTGDTESDLASAGWYKGNSEGKPHAGGQKKANAWGLYDMHGNVREWCNDWSREYPKGAVTDPSGPSSGTSRVTRGGDWYGTAYGSRSADRDKFPADWHNHFIGFRVVLDFSARGGDEKPGKTVIPTSEPISPNPLLHPAAIPGVKGWNIHLRKTGIPRIWGSGLAGSPDGSQVTIVATSGSFLNYLIESNGGPLKPLRLGEGFHFLTWSPDGTLLAALHGEGKVQLFERDTWKKRPGTFEKEGLWMIAAWSADSQMIAMGNISGEIRLRDTKTGSETRFKKHSECVCAVAWHASSNRIISNGNDGSSVIWNAATGETIHELPKYKGGIPHLAVTFDGRVVDGVGRVFNVMTGAADTNFPRRVHRVSESPDGRVVAGVHPDGGVNLCRRMNGEWSAPLPLMGEPNSTIKLSWLGNDRILGHNDGPSFSMWSVDGRLLGTHVILPGDKLLTLSPEGHFLGPLGAEDFLIFVVQREDGVEERLTPSEFAAKYNWKNDPSKVRLDGGANNPASAQPLAKPLDLLKLIDTKQDIVKGIWTNENGKLDLRVKQANQIEQFSRLTVPIVPEEGKAYHVRVKFSSPQNGRGISVLVPVGRTQAMVGVASVCGISSIDGKGIGVPGNTTTTPATLTAGKTYTLDIWVRPVPAPGAGDAQVEIEAKLDDKALFKWTGKQASLALPANYDMPRGDTLGLAEWSLAPCTVHEMTLEMEGGGKATPLRAP